MLGVLFVFLHKTQDTRKMSLVALEEIQTVMMLLTDVLGKDIAKLVWQYYARRITREQKLAILLESEKKNKHRYQDLKEFQYNFRCDMSGHTAYARFFFVQNIDRTLIYQRYRHIDRVRRVNGLDSRYGNHTNKKPPSRAGICTRVMERWKIWMRQMYCLIAELEGNEVDMGRLSVRETGELGKHGKQIYTISHPIFAEKKKSKRKLEE